MVFNLGAVHIIKTYLPNLPYLSKIRISFCFNFSFQGPLLRAHLLKLETLNDEIIHFFSSF